MNDFEGVAMPNSTCIEVSCERSAYRRDWCNVHYKRGLASGTIKLTPHRDSLERFWEKVDKGSVDDCWNWKASLFQGTGYGQFCPGGRKPVGAHRWIYQQTFGPIPEKMFVDHICHNRACVNVSHMRLVTNKQNMENVKGAPVTSKTGVLGVHRYTPTNGYRGQVKHHGKRYFTPVRATIAEVESEVVALRLSLFTHNDHDRVVIHDGLVNI
jgi:hypothetical protein